MMLLDAQESRLLLVDYQQKLMPAIHEADMVLDNALRLAQIARLLHVPLAGTEQNPQGLGPNVQALRALCEHTFSKMEFGGAYAPDLQNWLKPAPAGNARSLPRHMQRERQAQPQRSSIVTAGCEAHVCLLQTALGLLEQEWDVWVVTDACSSRTPRNRDAAFDRLAAAGAELVTTEMVAFEWLRNAQHPAFREVLALVK